jgi:hypothetical protein
MQILLYVCSLIMKQIGKSSRFFPHSLCEIEKETSSVSDWVFVIFGSSLFGDFGLVVQVGFLSHLYKEFIQ